MKKEVYNYYVNYDNQLLDVKNMNSNYINYWMMSISLLSVILSFILCCQSKTNWVIFSSVLSILSMITFKISCSTAIEDLDDERNRIADIISNDKMGDNEKLDKMDTYIINKKGKMIGVYNSLTILFGTISIILSFILI